MRTLLSLALPLLLMHPDPPTGGADLIEVDLPGGVKVKLPKDEATKVIAGRDADKEERRKKDERLGQLDSDRRAAEDKARKAEEDKQLEIASKAGDIAKVREIGMQATTRLAEKYRDRSLEAAVAKNTTVIPEAAGDIAAQLRASCRFDVETDMLVVIDAAGKPQVGQDGKPVSVDALIAQYVEARPYFRKASGTQGSGASGKGGDAGGKTMTPEQISALEPMARAKFFASGGKQLP